MTCDHCAGMNKQVHINTDFGIVVIFNHKPKTLTIFQSTLTEFWTHVCPVASAWNNVQQRWSQGFSNPIQENLAFGRWSKNMQTKTVFQKKDIILPPPAPPCFGSFELEPLR